VDLDAVLRDLMANQAATRVAEIAVTGDASKVGAPFDTASPSSGTGRHMGVLGQPRREGGHSACLEAAKRRTLKPRLSASGRSAGSVVASGGLVIDLMQLGRELAKWRSLVDLPANFGVHLAQG
jgi:hypothetical protein